MDAELLCGWRVSGSRLAKVAAVVSPARDGIIGAPFGAGARGEPWTGSGDERALSALPVRV